MKHAAPLETEVKVRIPGPSALRPLLEALGFQEAIPAQEEISVLWDRAGELRAQGCALRLRRYAGKAVLTWKGPLVPDPLLKIRPEHETDVADPEALEAILEGLGYAPVLRMVKARAVWTRSELEACLDETPFGAFLELEGDPQAIKLAMEGLGLNKAHVETRSYPALWREAGLA